jgi:hypothetical protein
MHKQMVDDQGPGVNFAAPHGHAQQAHEMSSMPPSLPPTI